MSAPPVSRVIVLAETGSTNADAMRLALAGEALPLWVRADRQTAGRGRSGRVWTSQSGNFHASVAFLSRAPLSAAGQLALVAAIAILDAITDICGPGTTLAHPHLRLKWPNDVLIGTAKTGGILVETTQARGEPGFLAVIGFGVNLASHPDDLGRAVTSLAQHGAAASPDALLTALDGALARRLGEWDEGRGFDAVRAAWMARAGAPGEALAVNTRDGRLAGTYQGLAPSGALLLDVAGVRHEVSYGDVALVASGEAT